MISDLNELSDLLDSVVKTPCHMARILDIAERHKENMVMSKQISDLITGNIYKRKPNEVLSAISVIDSLLRQVGESYTHHISGKIIELFINAYKMVDDFKSKNTFYMIRQNWNKVFTTTLLDKLDTDMVKIDENWPVLSNMLVAQNKKPLKYKQRNSKETWTSSKGLKCPNQQYQSDLSRNKDLCPSRSSNINTDQTMSLSTDTLINPNINTHYENTPIHSNACVPQKISVPPLGRPIHAFGKPIIPLTNLPPRPDQPLAPSAVSIESQSKPITSVKIPPPLPGNPILSSKVPSSAQCQFRSSSSTPHSVPYGPSHPMNMSMYPPQMRMPPSQMYMSRPNMQMPLQGMPMIPPHMRMPPSQMRMPPPHMRMPPPSMRMPHPHMRMPSPYMQMPRLPKSTPLSNLCMPSKDIVSTFTDVNIPEDVVKPSTDIQTSVEKLIHPTNVSINHPNIPIQLPDIHKPPPDFFMPLPNAHMLPPNMSMQLPDLHVPPPSFKPYEISSDYDVCDHGNVETPSYEPLDTDSKVYNPGVYNPNYEIFAINSRYFETMPEKTEDYSQYQNVNIDRSVTTGDYDFESARYPGESPIRAPKVRKCSDTETSGFKNVSFLPPLKSLLSNSDNENQISLKNYSFCFFMTFNEEEAKKLYDGEPCTICFMRFKSKKSKEFERHMDFHFKTRSDVLLSRKYALNFPFWIESSCKTNDDSETIKEIETNQVQTCRMFDDPSKNKCGVCMEDFDTKWDDEEESYMLQNAVLHEGSPYHPICVEDIHKN